MSEVGTVRSGVGAVQEEFEQKVAGLLDQLEPRRLQGSSNAKDAAVLISIVFRSGSPRFLLTRRSEQVATHKGQISFPGGLREPDDRDLRETALRETSEEIGAAPETVRLLGEFHDYVAITEHLVRPYVGVLPAEEKYSPQTDEVDYLLEVPVEFFLETEPVVEQRLVRGRVQPVFYFDYQGDTVWGLTARIIKDFLDLLTETKA
jgi:8-oxo-dGTP pyrophosphatase MutT (NUDIX family)